jgi:hypothetical protein
MNRRPRATDGTDPNRNASLHPTHNQPVIAGTSNLRRAIIMTNRKCLHVR